VVAGTESTETAATDDGEAGESADDEAEEK
jgi:hypothetical protein